MNAHVTPVTQPSQVRESIVERVMVDVVTMESLTLLTHFTSEPSHAFQQEFSGLPSAGNGLPIRWVSPVEFNKALTALHQIALYPLLLKFLAPSGVVPMVLGQAPLLPVQHPINTRANSVVLFMLRSPGTFEATTRTELLLGGGPRLPWEARIANWTSHTRKW